MFQVIHFQPSVSSLDVNDVEDMYPADDNDVDELCQRAAPVVDAAAEVCALRKGETEHDHSEIRS